MKIFRDASLAMICVAVLFILYLFEIEAQPSPHQPDALSPLIRHAERLLSRDGAEPYPLAPWSLPYDTLRTGVPLRGVALGDFLRLLPIMAEAGRSSSSK